MSSKIRWVVAVLFLMALVVAGSTAMATSEADAEAIYAEWSQHQADRQPALAMAMTSSNFTMVNNETVMNRSEAGTYLDSLSQFVVSRECTHHTVVGQLLSQRSFTLLTRVDCLFHTAAGSIEAHYLETMIVDSKGRIVYDALSDIANPSLP